MKVMGNVFVFSKLYYQKKILRGVIANLFRARVHFVPFFYRTFFFLQKLAVGYCPNLVCTNSNKPIDRWSEDLCEIYIWGSQLMIPGAI
jgi:hypothetical protein